jgi:molybdopterin converting factor small subunit
VKVTVRYLAQLRAATGAAAEEVELPRPCSVQELVLRLADRHGDAARRLLTGANGHLQTAVLLFLGDDQVGAPGETMLRDGDVLTLLTPVAGGEGG